MKCEIKKYSDREYRIALDRKEMAEVIYKNDWRGPCWNVYVYDRHVTIGGVLGWLWRRTFRTKMEALRWAKGWLLSERGHVNFGDKYMDSARKYDDPHKTSLAKYREKLKRQGRLRRSKITNGDIEVSVLRKLYELKYGRWGSGITISSYRILWGVWEFTGVNRVSTEKFKRLGV